MSGDETIKPSDEVLRRAGRRVRFDNQVDDDAAVELKEGKRFIVVAHGQSNGTVRWYKSSTGNAERWLWVGMERPPKRTRVYLYCCKSGAKLPHFLSGCEVFGHIDVVPMPTGGAQDVVLGFLSVVERLVSSTDFDFALWRAHLARYVNREYAAEVEAPRGMLRTSALLMLRQSLGNLDP